MQFLTHKANNCENIGQKYIAQPADQQKKKKNQT